jgi:hypothetical protein
MGSFASPPQLDLVIPTPCYKSGVHVSPTTSVLTDTDAHAADR